MHTRDVARKIADQYHKLDCKVVAQLSQILVALPLLKGERVEDAHRADSALYYVERGLAREYVHHGEHEVTHRIYHEGCMVLSAGHDLEALETTLLYAIPRKSLELLMEHSPEVRTLYSKILEREVASLWQQLHNLRFEDATQRYEGLLLHRPQIVLRAKMSHIASYLNMTPETLSRVRHKLKTRKEGGVN